MYLLVRRESGCHHAEVCALIQIKIVIVHTCILISMSKQQNIHVFFQNFLL